MAVNESKARHDSRQWANWRNYHPSAIGTMESARAREKAAHTIPAQVVEGPKTPWHIASSVIGDSSRERVWVSTVDLGQTKGFVADSVFETTVFEVPTDRVKVDKEELEWILTERMSTADRNPDLQPHIEVRRGSQSAALRQHDRAVKAATISLGTSKI